MADGAVGEVRDLERRKVTFVPKNWLRQLPTAAALPPPAALPVLLAGVRGLGADRAWSGFPQGRYASILWPSPPYPGAAYWCPRRV